MRHLSITPRYLPTAGGSCLISPTFNTFKKPMVLWGIVPGQIFAAAAPSLSLTFLERNQK